MLLGGVREGGEVVERRGGQRRRSRFEGRSGGWALRKGNCLQTLCLLKVDDVWELVVGGENLLLLLLLWWYRRILPLLFLPRRPFRWRHGYHPRK